MSLSRGQGDEEIPAWLQYLGASRRVTAQSRGAANSVVFDDRLAQICGQAASSSAHRASRAPPHPKADPTGVFRNSAFLQLLLQQRLQPSLQPQPQPDQLGADSALLTQIWEANAARTKHPQEAADQLAALQMFQQWQQVRAQNPVVARSTQGSNNALVQSILAKLNAGQNLGAPVHAGGTSTKKQEPATSIPVEKPSDVDQLSKYQVLIRRQLEYFISQKEDADYSVQGRKKQARLGQVGIRCRHCSHLPHRLRGRGSGYYPAKLSSVYQAAQNMATNHLHQFCSKIPPETREQLHDLRGGRNDSAVGGGKQYWADTCQEIGLVEEDDGLRFRSSRVLPQDS